MIRNGKVLSFYEVLTAAVADISRYGYDSQERIEYWMKEIADAAIRDAISEDRLREKLNETLSGLYESLVGRGKILATNPGVSRFTLDRVKPALRAELDRRIMASANLIKLNREGAIQKTLQRFSGWATSIPKGGSDVVDKNDTKTGIRKSLAQLPFEERRVLIDQGHKLSASLSEILALEGGAIAGEWHSQWRRAGYNYREDHKERDMQVYTIRNNWAMQKGLMKAGPCGYTDDITAAGEEVFCRCSIRYLYNIRDLPETMLTAKGAAALKEVRNG